MNNGIIIAFVFIVSLIAIPLTSNAFSQQIESKATIDAICGVDISENINFGTITPGTIHPEIETYFKTSGSVTSTVSLITSDWVGAGSYATGKIYLNGVVDGESITINGLEYTANSPPQEDWEFGIGDKDSGDANRLAATINDDTRIGITNPKQDVTAILTDNMIKLQATKLGKTGNDIDVSSSDSSFTITNPTLSGAQDVGAIHLYSEVTKFSIYTNGEEGKSPNYLNKNSFGSDGESISLTSTASPSDPIRLVLQLSTEGDNLKNMPYQGEITQTLTFSVECNN